MAGIYGSARAAHFLRELAAGDDSLDVIVIGDSNAGYPASGGYTLGWDSCLTSNSCPIYATGIQFAAANDGEPTGAFGPISGWTLLHQQVAVGNLLSGKDSGPAALTALAVPAAGDLYPGGATGANYPWVATGTTYALGFSVLLDSVNAPSPGDWDESGTTLKWRGVYGTVAAGTGAGFTATAYNVTSNTLLASQAFNCSTGSNGLAVGEFSFTSVAARMGVGWNYQTTVQGGTGGASNTAGAGCVWQSVYRVRKGYAVTCLYYNGGSTVTTMAGDIEDAGTTYWANFFTEVIARQVAAGGSGRVLISVNGGINGPSNTAQWQAGMEAIYDALYAGWNAATGSDPENFAMECSVTHPLNAAFYAATEAVLTVVRTASESWDALGEKAGLTYVNYADLITAAEMVTLGYYFGTGADQAHLSPTGYPAMTELKYAAMAEYPPQPDEPRYTRDRYVVVGVPDPATTATPIGCDMTQLETGEKFTRKANGDFARHPPASDDGTFPLTAGGTGADNADDARTNLGLGSVAVQNASDVDIQGGNIRVESLQVVDESGTGGNSVRVQFPENLSSNRDLNITLNDANRAIDLGGDFTTDGATTITAAAASVLDETTTSAMLAALGGASTARAAGMALIF